MRRALINHEEIFLRLQPCSIVKSKREKRIEKVTVISFSPTYIGYFKDVGS